MMEHHMNSVVDKKAVADPNALLRSIKLLVKDLAKILSKITDVEDLFLDENIAEGRQKIYDGCLKLMQVDKFRRESVDIMWTYCFYEPIRLYKSVNDLDDEDRARIKQFISACIASIAELLDQFTDIRATLFTYLGDLHRYSYTIADQNVHDLTAAEESYKKALKLNSENGHPFNQLALLLKEQNPEHALSLFLRACILPKPFTHALRNLRTLKQNEFKLRPSLSLYNLVDLLIFDFGRVPFEEERKHFDEFFDESLRQSEHLAAVRLIHLFALAAIYALLNDENDEKIRCAISFLFRKWTCLLAEVEKQLEERKLKEDEEQFAKKRRRGDSSSSDSSETNLEQENENCGDELEFGKDYTWALITSIFEFLDLTEGRFVGRKLPVSLKLQFQNLLKNLVDILNELMPKLRPKILKKDENESGPIKDISEWIINGPFSDANEEEKCDIAGQFINRFLKNRRPAITFDKFFQLSSNVSEEKELKSMEAFSKMHLQHVTEENERTSRIPVYVAPDFFVLVHKLDLIRQLFSSLNQTILIARSVLSRLDKVKKENSSAREAIRWIQNSIPEGRVRMLSHTGEKFVCECLQFLREKGLLEKKTLFCSILTTDGGFGEYDQQMEEIRRYNAVSVENIADFIARIVSNGSKMV